MRTDDEKLALSLHRYKNWVEIMTTAGQRMVEAKRALDEAGEQVVYAYLEAREEQERLLGLGATEATIKAVVPTPLAQPLDPLTIVKRSQGGRVG